MKTNKILNRAVATAAFVGVAFILSAFCRETSAQTGAATPASAFKF